MALWFFRGLRKGIVTTRYPAVTDAWAAGLPTPPLFDEGHLSSALADRLIEICPSYALTKEDGYLVLDVGACTACGRCIAEAPGTARPSGVFELAATRREQLVKRIRIVGG
jgi:hypothetical protein